MAEWKDKFGALLTCRDAEAVERILADQFLDYRRLFYGLSAEKFNAVKFEYENVLDGLFSGALAGLPPQRLSPGMTGLLVLFGSFFERGHMYGSLHEVTQYLPASPAKDMLSALYAIRSVSNISSGYNSCMDNVSMLLVRSAQAGDELVKSACAWICREYASLAILDMKQQDHDALAKAFSAKLGAIFRKVDCWPHDVSRWSAPDESVAVFQCGVEEARRHVVELLFDYASSLAGILVADEGEIEDATLPQEDASPLPEYLENALFHENGARYRQIPHAVVQGLNADTEQNRVYLGTYFPRSFQEAYLIVGEALRVPSVRQALLINKPVLNIFDVGSGTGGTLCGLLQALHNAGFKGRYKILSTDGNREALAYQRSLLNQVRSENGLLMETNFECITFPTTMDACRETLVNWHREKNGSVDIIVSWKFISEFYNANYAQALGVAGCFVNRFSELLARDGLCIIADVTCKDAGEHEWFPLTLNREIHAHTGGGRPLHCLVPLSCLHWAGTCKSHRKCFSQRTFRISHRQACGDVSRIYYRVLAGREIVERIRETQKAHPAYRISPNDACRQGVVLRGGGLSVPVSAYTFQ